MTDEGSARESLMRNATYAPSPDPRLRVGHRLPRGEREDQRHARGERALLRSSKNTACAPNRFQSHHGALTRTGLP
jgi:hypothetical protein